MTPARKSQEGTPEERKLIADMKGTMRHASFSEIEDLQERFDASVHTMTEGFEGIADTVAGLDNKLETLADRVKYLGAMIERLECTARTLIDAVHENTSKKAPIIYHALASRRDRKTTLMSVREAARTLAARRRELRHKNQGSLDYGGDR